MKIYLDAGHNPTNPNAGAEGNGYREQDLVYEIARQTAVILRQNGLEVRLSRPTPQTQLGTSNASSLAARVNDANAWGADYFISLHTNASTITSASGSEAFVYTEASRAYPLAQNILTQLNAATGLPNRGVSVRTNLYVLRRTRMPATLVELGFISNPADADLMANQPQLFARGVANGVLAYLGEL
jgi:N-acetylmuramoyl-L-alanine amidase